MGICSRKQKDPQEAGDKPSLISSEKMISLGGASDLNLRWEVSGKNVPRREPLRAHTDGSWSLMWKNDFNHIYLVKTLFVFLRHRAPKSSWLFTIPHLTVHKEP